MNEEIHNAIKRATFALDHIHPSKQFIGWSGPREGNTVSIMPGDLRTIIARLVELEQAACPHIHTGEGKCYSCGKKLHDNESNRASP